MMERTHHKPVNLNKNPTLGTATFSDRRSRYSLIAYTLLAINETRVL